MARPLAPRLALFLGLAASFALAPLTRADAKETETAPAKSEEAPAASHEKGSNAPVTLDFYGVFGPSVRVGGAPGFEVTRRLGPLAGAGIVFAPIRSFALGLSFEHADLGSERLGAREIGSATADRSMNGLWLDLRIHPYQGEVASIFAGLGLGLGWQLASASRVEDPEGTGRTVTLTLCEASDSASVGLRGGGGLEVALGGSFFLLGDAWIENARLSGEVLDACIGGAGTSTLFTVRAGLAYRLDLSSAFVSR
jgi:opacity protein-like surface antigen